MSFLPILGRSNGQREMKTTANSCAAAESNFISANWWRAHASPAFSYERLGLMIVSGLIALRFCPTFPARKSR
jgi:hypothetical protein